ncbi:MAG: DJ-1/PfpI family protein [Planctomycetota bacterium]
MSKAKLVAMVAFPDFQMLDVMGPLEVFARTSRWLVDHRRADGDSYRVEVLGLRKGLVRASSGIAVLAERGIASVRGGIDTLLVAGGRGAEAASREPTLQRWLRTQAHQVRRIGSVCTGTFLLAAAGLLDGRRAATHWAAAGALAKSFPRVQVDQESLFVHDDRVYTSAGVTAGMDLALALVEADHGRDVSLAVARELVMFVRRTGGQPQLSAPLQSQLAMRRPLRELQAYIHEHPDEPLRVAELAERVAMSPRNFARAFAAETGDTPAQFVRKARLDTARRLLEESTLGLDELAIASGFGTAQNLRRAFEQHLGVPPSQYRERFERRDRTQPDQHPDPQARIHTSKRTNR